MFFGSHDTSWPGLRRRCVCVRETGTGSGTIGAFHVQGRIDFLVIRWFEGSPTLLLVECKSSRKDRTYQRIQAAIYLILLRARATSHELLIAGQQVEQGRIDALVVRVDETTRTTHSILDSAPFKLDLEEADVERLLAADGILRSLLDTPLEDVPYTIDAKCDSCVFTVNCLPWSAHRRRLELLGLKPSLIRALHSEDVIGIDDLAELDLTSAAAEALRRSTGLTEPLERIITLARTRRTNLSEERDPEERTYSVEQFAHSGYGQLPPHRQNGAQLVRCFLSVEYDYTEDRIGALSAHVTNSTGRAHTQWTERDGRRAPDPRVFEQPFIGNNDLGYPQYDGDVPLDGTDIVEIIQNEWQHDVAVDNAMEHQLISSFFSRVVEAISERGNNGQVTLHFYVWNKSELKRLVEACARSSSALLSSLRELLGCREGLEQIIFSSLQDEVDSRFALGWTGRGVGVVTSLSWFGRRYHWNRVLNGQIVELDRLFTQDIFDFKTTLDVDAGGAFIAPEPANRKELYEIRSRFNDSLTAPYWRAYWGTLQEQPRMNALTRRAIQRYNAAAGIPGQLAMYLRERVHALRWIEESISRKNSQLRKAAVAIAQLPRFSLNVVDVGRAGIDFIQLDHHVKVQNWIAEHLAVPADRIARGRTLPVENVVDLGGSQLTATIAVARFALSLEELRQRTTFTEDAFVRLSPASEDVNTAQNVGDFLSAGKTCKIDRINWNTGEVRFSVIGGGFNSRYTFPSAYTENAGAVLMPFATIDESLSDFVSGRVEERLASGQGTHVLRWFDPTNPVIPVRRPSEDAVLQRQRAFMASVEFGGQGERLDAEQLESVLAGMGSTVQLLQGPPGTGKTTTTAASVLLRGMSDCTAGDMIIVTAHTHTAVDTLLKRLVIAQQDLALKAAEQHLQRLPASIFKMHTSAIEPIGAGVQDLSANSANVNRLRAAGAAGILIIGGTPSALLKFVGKSDQTAAFRNGLPARHLIVDEASMMVLPHFLAVATILRSDGAIFLAGDHRQLSPIVAHDWESEDRPPILTYQPFVSAYQAVDSISALPTVSSGSARTDRLTTTYRLPAAVVDLLNRLYALDNVELAGHRPERYNAMPAANPFQEIWRQERGLYLVVHNERQSREINNLEARVIQQLIAASEVEHSTASISIITPHRAQRTMLTSVLSEDSIDDGCIRVIDTVEKMQGDECENIIVSGTVSDPSAIAATPEFYLNLNRANVAFSRTKRRLVVVCASTLLDHVPPDQDDYENALLWKTLRELCSRELGIVDFGETRVRVLAPSLIDEAAFAH